MRLAVVLAFFVLAACEPVLPGETVGTFDVVGALDANTCGSTAVPAIDPLVFMAEIRVDSNRAFWRRPDVGSRAGVVMPDGTFRFTFGSLVRVQAADPSIGFPGCVLEQREVLDATVTATESEDLPDAGAPDGAAAGDADATTDAPPVELGGTNTIDLAPAAGSDCRALLGANGGPWAALPCGLRYTLRGDPRDPF